MDLRIRVVKAYEMGEGTQADIGRLFNLGVATVKRWIWRKASIGEPARLPRGGGNHRRIGQKLYCWVFLRGHRMQLWPS